jgi:hypothetical protein
MQKWVFVLGLVVAAFTASAGSIITSNLPVNSVIINIDATRDGAANYGGPNQAFWYQPFETGGTPPAYTFPAGTYSFTVLDPADAAALLPALTPGQLSQLYTAWTYNSPWIEDYVVFDGAALSNNSLPQIFDGAPDPTGFGNPTAAYNDAVANHYTTLIRPGPDGRAGTTFTNSYTITNASQTLVFVIPDYALSDNQGGVSILVAPLSLQPVLTIAKAAPGNVRLQWLVNGSDGFNLEQEATPAAWATVATTPTSDTTNYSVTIPSSGTTELFRLHKQN